MNSLTTLSPAARKGSRYIVPPPEAHCELDVECKREQNGEVWNVYYLLRAGSITKAEHTSM